MNNNLRKFFKTRLSIYSIACFLLIFMLNSSCFGQSVYDHIPGEVDTCQKFIFYLHGRIIEEKGIRPVSEEYGVYEYEKIVQSLADSGFIVISEARGKNTDPDSYAKKVVAQIELLLAAGVPGSGITVVGASKGAAITVLISNYLRNYNVKFVLMAICNDSMADYWNKNNILLWGKILYIYDRSDVLAGSCEKYLPTLTSEGLKEYKELELNRGEGHGILYRPVKEWVDPVIQWADH